MADKDVNIHIRSKDTDATKRDVDGVAASTERLGKTTEQAGRKSEQAGRRAQAGGKQIGGMGANARKTSGLMTALGTAVKGVTGYLAGMVSVAGLFAFFKKWLDWIKAIAGAQKELVESTKDLDQAAKALASQANIMGTEKGMDTARKQILRIAKAGGTTIGVAEGVAVSAHSAFGMSGQLLTPEQEGIAGMVAGFAQRKEISGGGTNQLLKLLAAMGVTDAEEAKQRIQQLSTVQQASKAKTFEEFAGGAIKAMVPMLAQGASPGFALSSYASSLDVNATADLAAEQVKQMSAILQNPKVLQAMATDRGTSEMDIRNLPFDQRMSMFSGWVSTNAATGLGQKKLLSAGLSAEQLNVASTLFAAKQLERRAMFGGLAEGATAEGFSVEAEGYAKTTQGRTETMGSEAQIAAASATVDERIGEAMDARSEAEWKRMKGRGETPFHFSKWGDKYARIRELVREPMVERMWSLPESEEKEVIKKRLLAEPTLQLTNPFMVGEIGEMDRLLGAAEKKYSGQLRNMRQVRPSTFRYRDYLPLGEYEVVEPEPAPPPADVEGGQPVSYIDQSQHYDYSVNLNRPGLSADELGMGPRYDPYA